jgi:hypothetical protein
MLNEIPLLKPPILLDSSLESLYLIQKFIESFQYNYTGKPFFVLKKNGGIQHLVTVTKQMIQHCVPIQCVEAVFIGIYLSAPLRDVERFPLCFKSNFRGEIHRHIVLAVKINNTWGALGISRRSNLMFKDIKYQSLYELIVDYKTSYEDVFHVLLTFYVGLPLPHDLSIDDRITWKAIKIRLFNSSQDEIKSILEDFITNNNK